MLKRFNLAMAFVLGAILPQAALPHAAFVTAQEVQAISIRGQYDTGTPMDGAQVIVYAPDNPAQPWTTGTADDLGRFLLFPDRSLTGRWTVQMRQAGHGAVVYVEIGAAEGAQIAPMSTARSQGPGLIQRLVMMALVAWGALGTVLFFWRRRGGDASS